MRVRVYQSEEATRAARLHAGHGCCALLDSSDTFKNAGSIGHDCQCPWKGTACGETSKTWCGGSGCIGTRGKWLSAYAGWRSSADQSIIVAVDEQEPHREEASEHKRGETAGGKLHPAIENCEGAKGVPRGLERCTRNTLHADGEDATRVDGAHKDGVIGPGRHQRRVELLVHANPVDCVVDRHHKRQHACEGGGHSLPEAAARLRILPFMLAFVCEYNTIDKESDGERDCVTCVLITLYVRVRVEEAVWPESLRRTLNLPRDQCAQQCCRHE
mmetsp:Transcript_47386/g.101152  ORF Transcript_47386/g.101152 Transcript_47386/m.101152 type:complete len:273 (+) Transcript_47386:70-888(+)